MEASNLLTLNYRYSRIIGNPWLANKRLTMAFYEYMKQIELEYISASINENIGNIIFIG